MGDAGLSQAPTDVRGDDDGRPETAEPAARADAPGPRLAAEDREGTPSEGSSAEGTPGQADQLPTGGRPSGVGHAFRRTPLFEAENAARYERQELIERYEAITGATLIVIIDAIYPENMTFMEELLFDADPERPMHVLLGSPGGDGETAIRMVRSLQARCCKLTVVVPDMAKSAGTLLCLGADEIVMGPSGDLGPVDPQFAIGRRGLVGAKEIVAAIDEAERRVTSAPDTFALFASLLADVNMLMFQQAKSAIDRSESLMREALGCATGRTDIEVSKLAGALKEPLIDEPTSHNAVVSAGQAEKWGLPVRAADLASEEWHLVWSLWTRYFTMGCFPAGPTAVYEGRRASRIMEPPTYQMVPNVPTTS